MDGKSWNVGVVGYGMSAKTFHIPFVTQLPELKLYAVVQRSPTPADDAATDHPGIKAYRNAQDMVRDAAVDVVVVTTAPDSHFELVKLALAAGKHVVCEKPFTPTSQEARELVAIARSQKKLLAVYQNRRWDADFVTLSTLAKNGSLGRLVEFESHFDRHRLVPNPSKWKNKVMPGGGAIFDLGTHLVDQAVHLLGRPSRITAFIGAQRQGDTGGFDDSFTVLLHYAGGLLATLKAAVVSPETEQLRFWVRGEKGSYKKFHLDIQEEQLKAGASPSDNGYGREPSSRYGTLTTIQDGSPVKEVFATVEPPTYTEFYRRFVRALEGKEDVPVSGDEAAEVIRLIELAKESSRLGQTLDV